MATRAFPPGVESALDFSLLDALYGRRARRFSLGACVPDGPLAFTSRHAPLPLSELEQMMVLTAAAGNTGWHYMITRHARCRGSCRPAKVRSGRTVQPENARTVERKRQDTRQRAGAQRRIQGVRRAAGANYLRPLRQIPRHRPEHLLFDLSPGAPPRSGILRLSFPLRRLSAHARRTHGALAWGGGRAAEIQRKSRVG
jgi:hypothetical protein